MRPRRQPLATAVVRALVPSGSRPWAEAMLAEWRALEAQPEEARRWLVQCLGGAVALRARDEGTRYATACVAAAAALIGLDWTNGAAMPSLIALVGSAAVLGWLAPEKVLRTSLVAGGALPLSHGLANLYRPLWPSYQYRPLDGMDWLILGSVVLPAALSAIAGAALRRTA